MAPSWMMISKAAARGPTKPSAWPARIRWPVDETGRNSVAPSTSPRMIAARRVDTASSYTKRGTVHPDLRDRGGGAVDASSDGPDVLHRPTLDAPGLDPGKLRRDADRLVHVRGLDQVEACEHFLGLRERSVRYRPATVP